MQMILEDRQNIVDLMTGWIHRDLAEWDKLRELFHGVRRYELKVWEVREGSLSFETKLSRAKLILS
jgi:hypothetical protein